MRVRQEVVKVWREGAGRVWLAHDEMETQEGLLSQGTR